MSEESNKPTQNSAGGNIHQDNRAYQSKRDMYVADGDINIYPRATQPQVTTPFYDIRHRQNPNFTGREAMLDELQSQLSQNQTTTITQTIAGLGGVGKTQLAVEYAHRHKEDYDIIGWLSADNELLLNNDLLALGIALQLIQQPITDQNAAIATVRRWFNSCDKRWLLLVDNADSLPPRTVSASLPTTGNGHILITSRNPNWSSVGAVLRLDVFTPDEATRYLHTRLGSVDDAECAALCDALGHFPLALAHAVAFIEQKQVSLATYHTYFKEQRQQLWAHIEPPNSYHATITTTWELAFQEIQNSADTVAVLNLCAFLDPTDIPLHLLQTAALTDNPLALDEALATLRRYSLLERDGEMITMHRMVQMVVRDQMGTERAQQWAKFCVTLLAKTYSFDEHDTDTWKSSSYLLSHNQSVVKFATVYEVAPEKCVWLLNQTAEYLQTFGAYKDAYECVQNAYTICKKSLPQNHPDTATSLNNMGSLLQAMGELDAAQPFYERALHIREQVLGENHPHTANSLNNIGFLLQAMGELKAARPFYERALHIREEALGENHPDTATSLNNIGSLLQAMGELETARPFYEQALHIREKVLGENHPHTARSLNNLAVLSEKIM